MHEVTIGHNNSFKNKSNAGSAKKIAEPAFFIKSKGHVFSEQLAV